MNNTIFLGLVQNAALLLALALIFDLTLIHWRTIDHSLRQIPLGLVVGGIGIALMLTPWVMVPGIIFDTRSILLGIAGLFFGLIPTAVAMLITVAFRITQGGTATVMGVCVILTTGSLGIAWGRMRRRPLLDISWRELYLFGLLIHAVMLVCAFTLPWATALQVLAQITLPVLLIYPVGTALLGALLANRLRSERAADQLRESEERLRLAVEASKIGFFDQDLLTNNEHYSAEWKKQIGYAEDELSDDIQEWQTRVHPDELAYALTRLDECIKGLQPQYEAEYRLRHKDGSYRWILARGMLQYNSDAQAVRLLGCHIDITRQKQDERLYRVLTENIQDVVWVLDTSTMYFRYVSPSVQRLRGYTSAEILAQPLDHALTAENREALLNLTRSRVEAFRSGQVLPGTFYTEEVEQPCKDGSTVWTEVITSYHLNPDNGHVEVHGVTRDIAARKQIEQTLRRSEENYRQLFDQAADGIFNADTQGNYVDVNLSGCALLGYTRQEILNLNMRDLVPVEDQEKDPLRLMELQNGLSVYNERRMLRKDGSLVDVEISGRKLADGRFLGMVRNITNRKRAEDQIQLLNAELEQRVRERTLQLESANKELESFAYSVSHDLRAPLRAMDGFSAALLSDYPDQIDEKGRHYLERIQEASRRMGQLINDLLSLSRVTRSEFNRQQVDLSELAREIAAVLRAQDPQRGLEFEIAPGLVCQGDPHLLRIVLENLLNNACKFTGRRDLARIQVGMLALDGKKNERVYFVRDNGVGFNMEYAGKLFAPFQRLHGMQEFPGTGIGLVTVQRIIYRHGGRVWPEAAPDQGATFYFTLGEA